MAHKLSGNMKGTEYERLVREKLVIEEEVDFEKLVREHLVKREESERITQRDLTQSEIPAARTGKRHNDRVAQRGEQFTNDYIRAVYQKSLRAITASAEQYSKMTRTPKAPLTSVKRNFGRAH